MSLARLDHVIYSVPNIQAAHRQLTARFPEAWPIGRFWPQGLTSGIAVGGINLELIQFDDLKIVDLRGTALAFQPTSFDDAVTGFAKASIAALIVNKSEENPELLKLRGFDEQAAQTPQWICRNLVPETPDDLPFDFFVCEYSPFMSRWLSPANPRLYTPNQITEIRIGTDQPEQARKLLKNLGYRGEILIRFVGHDDRRILGIETTHGSLDWPEPLHH